MDATKYEEGGTVTVRIKVAKRPPAWPKNYDHFIPYAREGWVCAISSSVVEVVSYEPPPPSPLKVGDRVQGLERPGTIIAIFEDRAWVRWDDFSIPTSPLLENLRRDTNAT
jgi:hypothetical protein